MASPHVAGVAALIIAAGIEDADNDGVINDDVRQRLTATADDLDNPLWYGYGLVNAVKAAESTTPPVPVIDIAVTDMQGPASVEQGVMVPFVVEVKNVGTVSIQSDIEVELTDHTVNALIGEKTIYGLKVRESTQLIYDWDTATADLGNHTISASIKLSDEIVWNNTYDKVVTVTESGVTPLSVAYLDPDTIDTNAQTDVTVFGSGLAPKAVVTFFDGKGVAPVATTIGVSEDGTRLYLKVTTRLTPKPVSWTVRVTNPNGDSALLVDGLTVQP
jgi:hypothetical protein